MAEEVIDPTLNHLFEKKSLKWIFVGGKGGVGKTTCSSSIAVQLSKVRDSVLIISTDPAHNLSDAFGQKFTKDPTLVKGFKNLFAMEIDPNVEHEDDSAPGSANAAAANPFMQELATSIPGIDEAMSFAEVMKLVQSMEFTCVVFDTAPTGHTLRLLQFPSMLSKTLGKFMGMGSQLGGLFSQFSSMMGGGAEGGDMAGKLDQTRAVIEEVNNQFKNPDLTTFVCVCIPEFLSLYETERLIQELVKFQIDTQDIIINQVLYPVKGSDCKMCTTRSRMQQKYIDQFYDLYNLFHIIKLPLLSNEIRGVPALETFSQNLKVPFVPKE